MQNMRVTYGWKESVTPKGGAKGAGSWPPLRSPYEFHSPHTVSNWLCKRYARNMSWPSLRFPTHKKLAQPLALSDHLLNVYCWFVDDDERSGVIFITVDVEATELLWVVTAEDNEDAHHSSDDACSYSVGICRSADCGHFGLVYSL